MKKSFLIAAGAALVSIAVSVYVYADNGKNEMEDLFYANVEALAETEGVPGGYASCFMDYSDSGASGYYLEIRECLNCTIVTAERVSRPSTCMK